MATNMIDRATIGNLDRDAVRAVVTCCPMGPGRWHIHTTYESVCDRPQAGYCGDATTEEDAEEMYEHAKELARKWHASKRVPW